MFTHRSVPSLLSPILTMCLVCPWFARPDEKEHRVRPEQGKHVQHPLMQAIRMEVRDDPSEATPPAKAHTQGACKSFSASPDSPIALPTLRATWPAEDVAVWLLPVRRLPHSSRPRQVKSSVYQATACRAVCTSSAPPSWGSHSLPVAHMLKAVILTPIDVCRLKA